MPAPKKCAAEGCEEPRVPAPAGRGRPTKYCLKHQLHKDRTRKRLKKEGHLEDAQPVSEDLAHQLAVWLGMTGGNVERALSLADLSPQQAQGLVARANDPDLKGLRDRTPTALGELFSGIAAIGALRIRSLLPSMEPSEVMSAIRTLEKAAERWGANEGKGSYAAITVVWPDHLFASKKKA